MSKSNLVLSEQTLLQEIKSLQKSSYLEQGRNEVLRMTAQGEKLDVILNTLCEKAQLYNKEMFCSVLQLNNETKTLHPVASISLPKFYCDAINGEKIGPNAGSCGAAAYKKERIIVEDINTHPYWVQYKKLALFAGLQACWSEPIIGSNGKVFGTFAMYYQEPKTPSPEDLQFIEMSANLAAVVFETNDTRQQLIKANNILSNTVDQRNLALEQANKDLELLVEQQSSQHIKQISDEKIQTTTSLVVGFANKINTPIAIALTANGVAEQQIQKLQQAVELNKLTRAEMTAIIQLITESIQLSNEKLILTSSQLEKFNDLSSIENNHKVTFELSDFFEELKSSLVKLLSHYSIQIETEKITLTCNKNALWKVIYQLIENSIIHGFAQRSHGNIFISATQKDSKLLITYLDDGIGIKKANHLKIFEPFFTTKVNQDNSGLGLSTIVSLLETTLSGEIKLIKSPTGTRFEITLNQY